MATQKKDEWLEHRYVLMHAQEIGGWLIWDRLHYRMSDGVYFVEEDAQRVCDSFNEDHARGDRDWYANERARSQIFGWTWQDWVNFH